MAARWWEKATVQASAVAGVVAGLTTLLVNYCAKPPSVTSVAVFGDVPQAFSSLTAMTAAHTVYFAPGTGDQSEEGAQLQFKSDTVMHELQCVSSGVHGAGPGHDVVITGRAGRCGHQENTPFGCTIRGTAEPNQSCDSSSSSQMVKGGDCADFRLDIQEKVEQPTYVNCTVGFARISEVLPGPGGLPHVRGTGSR